MSFPNNRSFRIKRKESDADTSSMSTSASTNDSVKTPRKRTNTFSRLFKRSSTSNSDQVRQKSSNPNLSSTNMTPSLSKSQSMSTTTKSKKSMDIPQLSVIESNRVSKSKSFPEALSSNRNSTVDLSKMPKLPDVSPIRSQRSKLEELDAVRKKLVGEKSLSRHNSSRNKDKSAISYKYDDQEDDDDLNHGPYKNTTYYSEDEDEELEHNNTFKNGEIVKVNELDEDDALNDIENDHHHRKILKNPHILGKTLSHTHLSKSSLKLQSSTPNHSDASIHKDAENTTSENTNNKTNEHTGLFSSLLNSINLKSFSDLTNHVHEAAEAADEVESVHSNPSVSSQKTTNEALDSVNFKPIKKALITTLGEGNLTLDSFPKNETRLLSEVDNKISVSRNANFDPPSNVSTIVANDDSATPSSDEIDHAIMNTNIKSQNTTRKFRSKSSLSPLPRKQTLRNSLSSILSSDEDVGENANDASGIPMSNSVSFKKKLKLPLTSKRLSLDNNLSRFTTNNEESSHPRKKEMLFEKLNIKAPTDKRQEAFHSIFPSLSPDELLVEDFTCAFRKDILVQGKLYLSENHICFHSNIIGLVTKFTIPLNAILKLQKKKTVGIPNAIEFSNLHNKYVFASFMSRDPTYDLIHKVWKTNINNEGLDTIDLDIDEDDADSLESVSTASSDDEDNPIDKKVKDNSVSNGQTNGDADTSDTSISDQENMVKDDDEEGSKADKDEEQLFNGLPFEGPKSHAPTSNGYTAESGDIKIIDELIKAPMGLVYGLLFGDDVTFVKNLLKTQKNYDISDIPKFTGKKRSYKYVKPINGGPVGPKQTKCLVDEEVEHMDFNSYCLVVQMTESPDVPSGNSFKVKTKIYLNWAPNNSTKLFAVTSFVWTGKSWIKGAIEKGGISGQKEALGIMVSELKKRITAGGKANLSPSKSKKKDKNKKVKEEQVEEEEEEEAQEEASEPEPPKSYMDLFMDQLDIKFIMIVVLFIIVICDKFSSKKSDTGYELYSNERMLMSESKLWEWIEQREKVPVSSKHLPNNVLNNRRNREPISYAAKKKMSQQELKGTIEMMESELYALKEKANQYEKLL